MTLGQRAFEVRKALGMSQTRFGALLAQQIGRALPYSQATIAYLEQDKVKQFSPPPHLEAVLERLARQKADFQQEAFVLNEDRTIRMVVNRRMRDHARFGGGRAVSFGTSDTMEMIDDGDTVRSIFVVAHRPKEIPTQLIFTRRPISFIAAMTKVLFVEGETIAEFFGENYQGRACFFAGQEMYPYCLVMQFWSPFAAGYLIHLENEEMLTLLGTFLALPVSVGLTD